MSKTNVNNVNDVIFRGVLSVVERHSAGHWNGTMTELNTTLNRVLSKKQRTMLPGSPGALRMVINKITNRLRNKGMSVRFGRTKDHMRTRFVRLISGNVAA